MPTFFQGLKRLISGQPVFQPGENVDGVTRKSDQIIEDQQQSQPVVAPGVEQPGTKIIPEVVIQRLEYRNNGQNMDIDADIRNNSGVEVLVDKINLLGGSHQIGLVLRPGEMREVPVYQGPRPNHRNYTNCELQYRDQMTGDYFASLHLVEYDAQQPDGTYTIHNVRFTPPVKDI